MSVLTRLKPHKINVQILKKYQNTYKFVLDKGRYVVETISGNGAVSTSRYLSLKKLKTRVPAPEQDFYTDVDSSPTYTFLQVNRFTFLPIVFINDNMVMKQPIYKPDTSRPIYRVDPQGEYILDEKGKKTILNYEPVKDKFGDSVVDRYEDIILCALDTVSKEGVLTKLPALLAAQTYNMEEYMADEYERANRQYATSFWGKYGNLVLAIVFSMVLVIGVVAGVKEILGGMQTMTAALNTMSQNLITVVDTLRVTTQTAGASVSSAPPF